MHAFNKTNREKDGADCYFSLPLYSSSLGHGVYGRLDVKTLLRNTRGVENMGEFRERKKRGKKER